MDYRHDTNYWSACSVADFTLYINTQSEFCLETLGTPFRAHATVIRVPKLFVSVLLSDILIKCFAALIFDFIDDCSYRTCCSPTDGTQGNCETGQSCYTDGYCSTQCYPKDGTMGNCPENQLCFIDGVCSATCSPSDNTQGNCPYGYMCQDNGVCSVGKIN